MFLSLQSLLNDSQLILPLLGLAGLALFILILQLLNASGKSILAVCAVGLVALIGYSAWSFDSTIQQLVFSRAAAWDGLSQSFNFLGLLIALAIVCLLIPQASARSAIFDDANEQLPELLVCLLLSTFGVGVLASATDLTSLFLGLETMSIGVYALCGFYRKELKSTESALKYLLIGAFSTVIFLYGVAFIYGATGSTNYADISAALETAPSALLQFGILFLVAGFAFKLAFVPFHLYTADVYEGAPTPVTAFMASIIKVGAAAASIRIFTGVLAPVVESWGPLWISLCIASILIGNLAALQQRSLKRLLAFSSISHAGFIGLALANAVPGASSNPLLPLMSYLVVYAAMSIGSFAVVYWLEDRSKPFSVEDLKGLGQQRFWPALFLSLFLLGLAGIPPFAGFMIKFWVLQGLVESGHWFAAISAVVGSIIGAAYYLKLLIYIFVSTEKGAASEWSGAPDRLMSLRILVIATALITLIGGLRPQLYTDWFLTSLALK